MNPTCLITGGTGSLGQVLVTRLLTEAKKIIVYSRDECKQVEMSRCIADPDKKIRYFLGDIRDRNRLRRAFAGVDYVIHTAALKHVCRGESDPSEFIKTNVGGSLNIIDAAIDCGVKKVLSVSSDKAVNPVSLYGATKLCADKLFIAANSYSGNDMTKFSVIRFGNFIGSRGSILPFCDELMKQRKLIPITDPKMVRYWIPIQDAASEALRSLSMMQGGETFVPVMEEVNLIGFIRRYYPRAEFEVIGKRNGEKLKEELFTGDETERAELREGIWVIPS